MKAAPYLTLLAGFIFLAGCSKSRPSSGVLEEALKKNLPGHLAITVKTPHYSPAREVFGTSLPEGSYQIDVQCQVTAKEPLYSGAPLSELKKDHRIPANLRAELDQLEQLSNWSGGRFYSGAQEKTKEAAFQVFITPVVQTGATEEFWVKIIAEPRGPDWALTLLEGNPRAAFLRAQPRSDFDPRAVIYGSQEQRKNVVDVQAAYDRVQKREAVLKTLAPKIVEIRKGKDDLARRYFAEAAEKMTRLRDERKKESEAHDQRIKEIGQATSQLRDDYKTRNALVKEETARWEKYASNSIGPRMKAAQEEGATSSKRAEEETEKKIAALLKEAGLDG